MIHLSWRTRSKLPYMNAPKFKPHTKITLNPILVTDFVCFWINYAIKKKRLEIYVIDWQKVESIKQSIRKEITDSCTYVRRDIATKKMSTTSILDNGARSILEYFCQAIQKHINFKRIPYFTMSWRTL